MADQKLASRVSDYHDLAIVAAQMYGQLGCEAGIITGIEPYVVDPTSIRQFTTPITMDKPILLNKPVTSKFIPTTRCVVHSCVGSKAIPHAVTFATG